MINCMKLIWPPALSLGQCFDSPMPALNCFADLYFHRHQPLRLAPLSGSTKSNVDPL